MSNSVASFDANSHLCYRKPTSTVSLDDLGLQVPEASSQTAITSPFPLLTSAGVEALRADIFRPEIVAKFGSWKYPGVYRIRGYGPAASFTYSMWRNSATIQACSDAAGVDLDIIMDYEIGQLNVQLPKNIKSSDSITDNLPPRVPPKAIDMDMPQDEDPEKDLVSAWHHDSYPWVCVLMLSDPVGMRGGETALRRGDGGVFKMRQPGMGYAVMMQGSAVSHAALRTTGIGERITFVVSFRPRDPMMPDSSSLRTVKPISDVGELFRQWTEYRLEVLSKRATATGRRVRTDVLSGRQTHQLVKQWAEEQIRYLQRTVDEMDPDDYILPNYRQ